MPTTTLSPASGFHGRISKYFEANGTTYLRQNATAGNGFVFDHEVIGDDVYIANGFLFVDLSALGSLQDVSAATLRIRHVQSVGENLDAPSTEPFPFEAYTLTVGNGAADSVLFENCGNTGAGAVLLKSESLAPYYNGGATVNVDVAFSAGGIAELQRLLDGGAALTGFSFQAAGPGISNIVQSPGALPIMQLLVTHAQGNPRSVSVARNPNGDRVLSWNAGSADSVTVWVATGVSTSPNVGSLNGTAPATLTADPAFPNPGGSSVADASTAATWYLVYKGTGTSVVVTGLEDVSDALLPCRAFVCEVNPTGSIYNPSTHSAGAFNGNPAAFNVLTEAAGTGAIPRATTNRPQDSRPYTSRSVPAE